MTRHAPDGLAERLEAVCAELEAVTAQAEQVGLFDATQWRTAVEQVEQAAEQAPDPEVASLLREAAGWIQTGDGTRPLPADFAGGLERIHDAIAMLRARA